MLDIQFIRDNPDKVKQNNKIRKCAVPVDDILTLDAERRGILTEIGEKRAELKAGSKKKPSPDEIKKLKSLGDSIKKLEEKLSPIESALHELLIQLPNITHKSVPEGRDETNNQEIKTWGKKPEFGFPVKDHAELGVALDLIDTDRGAKVSGARFWYLKNDLVMLEFALIQYSAHFMREKGFTPMLPPMLVREAAMFGTGFFPADKNEIYKVNADEDDLYLVGTAEVPLASYHADEVLDLSEPKKYFGFSSCFRREAGTYGKDTTGIIRGHQFDKVEMFVFCAEDQSWDMHEEMLAISEEFWQSLKIPYHVLNMCSGDIGAPNAKKYDIEGWFPAQNTYRELASCSNDTDFQARRLGIKYKDGDASKFAHTLNNTVCALGRTMVAIMENYQQKDGSIEIPKVLRDYMAGQKKIQA
ncbi:MAG: serine--tRNA ligase [Patescibacteria group bacterium]|nr:serine--tRNA ligase [Patescibacteria group bacterium]